MKLTDIHSRETEIRDIEHLETLLTETPGIDGYEAFVISGTMGEPELWVQFSGDVAYLHYFPTTDGSHPGFQPMSKDKPVHNTTPDMAIFLQVGGVWADRIEMPRETTLTRARAITAAKEFLESQNLPGCISWFEL